MALHLECHLQPKKSRYEEGFEDNADKKKVGKEGVCVAN